MIMKTLSELLKSHTLRPMRELTEEQQELVFIIQVLEFEYNNTKFKTDKWYEKKLADINKAYKEGEALNIFESGS